MQYRFPAMKGMQAGAEYFVCMVPLGILSKIFIEQDDSTLPEFRAQRRLNEARIPEIRDYILNNRDSYVFSALAASVDGNMLFVSQDGSSIGELEVDMSANFLINDGQHRKAAIIKAIEHDSSLKDETIAIVFYSDKGLERSQQMFADLNKHAVNASKSLNALYEFNEPTALITKQVVQQVPFFRKYTDKEKDNLGKFASKLFTLNTLYDANKRILKSSPKPEADLHFVLEYWRLVSENMREWNEMDKGELSKKELRENYISTQGITIHAMGRLGYYFYCHPEYDLAKKLKGLYSIDWSRSNALCWKERAITSAGRINRNEKGIFLTYIQIKRLLDIKIEKEELTREKQQL